MIRVKNLGLAEYLPVFEEMQEFTSRRDEATEDEIWMLQHPPVYTLGLAGNRSMSWKGTKFPSST